MPSCKKANVNIENSVYDFCELAKKVVHYNQ